MFDAQHTHIRNDPGANSTFLSHSVIESQKMKLIFSLKRNSVLWKSERYEIIFFRAVRGTIIKPSVRLLSFY